MIRAVLALVGVLLLTRSVCAGDNRPILAMQRVDEPNEKAFTFLCPIGWKLDGGIFNVNPMQTNGPGNSISPKCDLSVKKDEQGTVMLRWVASWNYADLRNAPAGALFMPGQFYQGMKVQPVMSCGEFLDWLFKVTRPEARDVKVIVEDELKEIAAAYAKRNEETNRQFVMMGLPPIKTTCLARAVEYTEQGTRYREVLYTSIIDMLGSAFMWSNSDTVIFRAPLKEFEQWKPALDVIRSSGQLNPQWAERVVRAMGERARIALETQQYINKVNNEIIENRRKTHAEIRHEGYLLLSGQEEYKNPFTGKVELDTSAYRYRWTDTTGRYIYTDENAFDPNKTEQYNTREWKRTPVNPR